MKTPLKTVLKNFLDHIDDLESRKKLYDDQYEVEFQELKKLTDTLKEDPAYQCSVGLKDVNRPKNRYKDIVPYDFSRVILPKHEGIPGSDYINASYVKGASGALAYIAAQGPLPNTVMDFWRMIWVCDVQVLVMACNEREAGKYKCEMYWPGPGEVKQYGNISIELVNSSQVCPDFLVRTLLVKCGSEMRDVYQFHYTSWPDHGVPSTVQPILDLVRLMRDCQASETVPIVVHCSAGCGRTGTLCAVDYVWACLRHGRLDEDFSLFQIALELRRQRIAMIQTKEQYVLAHRAVAAMFEQQLRVIDCHIYENLDEDGEPLIWKEVGKDKEFEIPDFMKRPDKQENGDVLLTHVHEGATLKNSNIQETDEQNKESLSCHSSTDRNPVEKPDDGIDSSRKNSESSYSRNSILSQHSNEDSIPFIDEEDVSVRPHCGRAYLNMPSCDSISKLVNCFDPFADKVSSGTDDSSPDGDPASNKLKDFKPETACKTLDKNAKFSSFTDNTCKIEATTRQTDCQPEVDSTLKASLPNRGSYPSSNIEKFHRGSSSFIDKKTDEIGNEKKVGRATVVRRPSISKLRSFFEKSSSQRSSHEGSKRVLFRNNSHHVARADSAPPSLDCMDRSSAVEKESILKMVTRKFRSSSVRTEREMQSKRMLDTCSDRKSTADTMKDRLSALTRTVSFSINKTFKSYSPAKMKAENADRMSSANLPESVAGIYKPKSPDQVTGNSMWYDKASLPRAVAIVKPSSNFGPDTCAKPVKSDPQSVDICKTQEASPAHTSKPAKIKEFFNSLNKKDANCPSTFWYNESNAEMHLNLNTIDSASKPESTVVHSFTKSTGKALPFLPIVPWKKVGQKSPLTSPDSPKSSTFYTDVVAVDSQSDDLSVKRTSADLTKCPVPEEIIPLNTAKNSFWPEGATASPTVLSNVSENPVIQTPRDEKDQKEEKVTCSEITELVDTKPDSKVSGTTDARPAIPKKMVIGKSKIIPNTNAELPCSQVDDSVSQDKPGDQKPHNEQNANQETPVEKNDLYINVNIKAMKNIEQIENTLRKNPRGAIIDLTSRESYSMEEELVNAVNQLSEQNREPPPAKDEIREKCKMLGIKNNSKFPGYEVIWPESSPVLVQKSKSSSRVPFVTTKNKLVEKNLDMAQNKTGLCYSPPLRRSVGGGMALSKSQSCGHLDWSEGNDPIAKLKETSTTPTKRLVNEAVVELNTLLNQLTTRTLSEDFDAKDKSAAKNIQEKNGMKNNELSNVKMNDTVVDSVILVTKSYNAGKSPKEEEIVFHFPPPPRGPPPPKVESPVESYNIVKKDGCLLFNKSSDSDTSERPMDTTENGSNSSSANSSESSSEQTMTKCPQPAPRKSKQSGGIRRSSSYTNIAPLQCKGKGYENVFLEKYQTLSKLEIKPDFDKKDILDPPVPFRKSPLTSKSVKISSSYVNMDAVPPVLQKKKEPCETAKSSNSARNTFDKIRMIMGDSQSEGNSVYGKIQRKTEVSESVNCMQNADGSKRKPTHSKKLERAPLPPNIKSDVNKETVVKTSPNNSLISKKLPSRKLEKAPPPPHLLQKSSSVTHVPKKNPAISHEQVERKSKLPAVRENVSDATAVVHRNAIPPQKFVNRGLSHSQSDVSVFRALKERKMASAFQEHKILNIKSLLLSKKTKTEAANASTSSDSDSSYEKIFLTKPDQNRKTAESGITPEKRTYRKEVPVAPPRSKRRSTTEVQYTKVKARDASHISSKTPLLEEMETKNPEVNCSTGAEEECPPAIPMKTKDAFEIPDREGRQEVRK